MSTAHIRYDLLVQDALKGVVRRVLTDAAREGLPGEHHFYISFRTDKAGVRLSQRLRERYPQDMTIVLQHQFTGLTVTEQAFEVGLSFSGIPERLRIPFDALTGFFDPSVQFGLKFETQDGSDDAGSEEARSDEPAPIPTLPGPAPKLGSRRKDKAEAQETAAAAPKEAASAEESGAEVVSLDAFRKKN